MTDPSIIVIQIEPLPTFKNTEIIEALPDKITLHEKYIEYKWSS